MSPDRARPSASSIWKLRPSRSQRLSLHVRLGEGRAGGLAVAPAERGDPLEEERAESSGAVPVARCGLRGGTSSVHVASAQEGQGKRRVALTG